LGVCVCELGSAENKGSGPQWGNRALDARGLVGGCWWRPSLINQACGGVWWCVAGRGEGHPRAAQRDTATHTLTRSQTGCQ
jgi:hypothetical protein